jgi:hypothetical protein
MSKEISIFKDKDNFEHAQRVAKMLSSSDLVPKDFKETGNGKGMANMMIAMNLANRIGADVLSICQNIHIIHGRPSWSSQFVIAALNSCGRFEPLQFIMANEGKADMECFVRTKDKQGNVLDGPIVSMAMAKAEGWADKAGSKWKTMPALMIRYRAAAFFGRLYAPDVLNGMYTAEEVIDMGQVGKAVEVIELPEVAVEKMLDKVKEKPSQEVIGELSESLTKLNVDPQQTMDIIQKAQEIVDGFLVAQPEPVVMTSSDLFGQEGGANG